MKALSAGYDDSDIFYLLGRLDHAKWNNPDLKEFVTTTLDGLASTGCSNPVKLMYVVGKLYSIKEFESYLHAKIVPSLTNVTWICIFRVFGHEDRCATEP